MGVGKDHASAGGEKDQKLHVDVAASGWRAQLSCKAEKILVHPSDRLLFLYLCPIDAFIFLAVM